GEVDVDARQVEQAREPGRNENDVKSLDPEHGGASDTTRGNGCIVVKDGASPALICVPGGALRRLGWPGRRCASGSGACRRPRPAAQAAPPPNSPGRPSQAAQGRGDEHAAAGVRCAGQMTYRSTYSCTGMACRVCWPRDASRMRDCWRGGKMRARLVRNLASSSGMPSWRRRLWPMGYSQTTSSSRAPSLNSTVSAFAMERLSGSW